MTSSASRKLRMLGLPEFRFRELCGLILGPPYQPIVNLPMLRATLYAKLEVYPLQAIFH
jgi:hypothetical protein